MTSYLDLGDDEQVAALRPVALVAAERFGLDVARLELAAHAYNTTFRLDTVQGRRYALRVNTNSTSTPAEVVAQQAWQVAIARETPLLLPEPVAAADGSLFAQVDAEPLGRDVIVTAASWLDGPDVGDPDPTVARAIGRAMAVLHGQAAGWALPPGGAMPTFDAPLFGVQDLLASPTGLDPEQRAVLDRAREAADEAFARAYAGATLRALHADLHGGNLKWHEGRLAIFDFDDCGLGVPALDLAVATFYLRGGDPAPEAALRAGYEVAPLPVVDPADFEALVASRQLLLANSLLASSTADFRAAAASYLLTSVHRLGHWQRSGRFTREVPAGD